MPGTETDHTGHRLGLDPNSTHATEQRERIVADDFTGTLDRERDRRIGEGLDRSILIRYSQHHTRRINAVTHQLEIVGRDVQLSVRAAQP